MATVGLTQDEYDLLLVNNTDWPKNDDYELFSLSTVEQCRSSCLSDCLCGVTVYRNSSCWKKKHPLSNGKANNTLNFVFLKFWKPDIPSPNRTLPNGARPRRRDRQTLIVGISVFLGSSAFINLLFITTVFLGLFLAYKKKFPARDTSGSNLHCFSYKELVQATNGFEEELGRGAFGIVYKGVMPINSNSIIAVKKLDRVLQDSEKEFRTEVNVIGHTHHKNLVSLIGFCDEGPHRLLAYEYMSNGTLAGFLFSDLKPN